MFKKLNLKDQREIVVSNAPAEFEPHLDSLQGVTVRRDPPPEGTIEFFLGFATRKAQVDEFADKIRGRLAADAVVWIAYPKGS